MALLNEEINNRLNIATKLMNDIAYREQLEEDKTDILIIIAGLEDDLKGNNSDICLSKNNSSNDGDEFAYLKSTKLEYLSNGMILVEIYLHNKDTDIISNRDNILLFSLDANDEEISLLSIYRRKKKTSEDLTNHYCVIEKNNIKCDIHSYKKSNNKIEFSIDYLKWYLD